MRPLGGLVECVGATSPDEKDRQKHGLSMVRTQDLAVVLLGSESAWKLSHVGERRSRQPAESLTR
jgi:hypothetical protein